MKEQVQQYQHGVYQRVGSHMMFKCGKELNLPFGLEYDYTDLQIKEENGNLIGKIKVKGWSDNFSISADDFSILENKYKKAIEVLEKIKWSGEPERKQIYQNAAFFRCPMCNCADLAYEFLKGENND